MSKENKWKESDWQPNGEILVRGDAIGYLKACLLNGEPWLMALLSAMRKWTLPREEVDGCHYQYFLLGEAFDWLALADRLLLEVDGLVPAKEKEALLFFNQLPQALPEAEFCQLIGSEKYRAYLNYFYGVVVEGSLLLAVEAEIRKERLSKGHLDNEEVVEWAYWRVYDQGCRPLLRTFQQELDRPRAFSLTLTELKEFTYWLFKRRISSSDSSRVASDTKKGLECLSMLQRSASSL